MTREELRTQLLAGADALRNSVAWRFMSTDQQMLSMAGRQFWATDNPTTDAALDAFAALLPLMRGETSQGAMENLCGTCGHKSLEHAAGTGRCWVVTCHCQQFVPQLNLRSTPPMPHNALWFVLNAVIVSWNVLREWIGGMLSGDKKK